MESFNAQCASHKVRQGGEQIVAENNEVVKIGTILKDKRIELGVTREQVAERSGISARYLIAIENEEKFPESPS